MSGDAKNSTPYFYLLVQFAHSMSREAVKKFSSNFPLKDIWKKEYLEKN